MFTGIIEDVGKVVTIQQTHQMVLLQIASSIITEDMHLGDSIAVNGVCLTVTKFDKHSFFVDAVPETVRTTTLHELHKGSAVNLERAMRADSRFGGHMVSGHVDCKGVIADIKKEENAVWFTIEVSQKAIKYMIPKGSVTLDGISLTIVDVSANNFTVSVIPHTLQCTVLKDRNKGDHINIECDMISKYIERFIVYRDQNSNKRDISMDFLKENGFY